MFENLEISAHGVQALCSIRAAGAPGGGGGAGGAGSGGGSGERGSSGAVIIEPCVLQFCMSERPRSLRGMIGPRFFATARVNHVRASANPRETATLVSMAERFITAIAPSA